MKLHLADGALRVEDLRARRLRPASASAFADDSTRLFRLARFAAQWPDWRVHAEVFAQMRALGVPGLAAIPAERVGQELLKALAAPAPARFFRVLAQGDGLLPWFEELEAARHIPAGPEQWHSSSVFGHSLRLMDLLAGEPLAVWMGLCHDLGKVGTDPALLPHHYGHEQRGVPLAHALRLRLRLPAVYGRAGALAAAEHMKAGLFGQLRVGTRRDLLWRVHRSRLGAQFWRMVDADCGAVVSAQAQRQLEALLPVKLPEAWRNQGLLSAEKLRELHCRALAALRDAADR